MGKDNLNPDYYKVHPSGIEAIQITEHFGFCLGNVIKYVWRAGLKDNTAEDLKKAMWYLERELSKYSKPEVKEFVRDSWATTLSREQLLGLHEKGCELEIAQHEYCKEGYSNWIEDSICSNCHQAFDDFGKKDCHGFEIKG